MSNIQERFITNTIEDTFYNNDDFLNIGNRDYTSGGGGNGGGYGGGGGYNSGGGYRGRIPHHRPIVIIQPPAATQGTADDSLLDGLTSLLPLAYLLPLALLVTAGASPTTVVGRRRREAEDHLLVSQCPERLSCVSQDPAARLSPIERDLARRLSRLLSDNKEISQARKRKINIAALWGRTYPGHCLTFKCRVP